jgi:hypothetical protein
VCCQNRSKSAVSAAIHDASFVGIRRQPHRKHADKRPSTIPFRPSRRQPGEASPVIGLNFQRSAFGDPPRSDIAIAGCRDVGQRGLVADLQLHLEHEVDLERVVEMRRTSAAAVTSLADAIREALPTLGEARKRQ